MLAGCWSHLRRRFYELHVSGASHVATRTVERMRDLWIVEDEIRGQTPELRRAARQGRSLLVVNELYTL
ncbi:MAG TPA: transposase [Alphaproteobacteria bacterium]|nr:transposase [Alphaproteobacteria bacterium]